MKCYSTEPRELIFVRGYIFLSLLKTSVKI